jgi:uncharacterized membrane protein
MINNLKVGLMALIGALGLSTIAAHAAVDTDVASLTSAMTNTTKENLMGVLTTNLPTVVIVGVAVLAIFFIWKLFRRFIGR